MFSLHPVQLPLRPSAAVKTEFFRNSNSSQNVLDLLGNLCRIFSGTLRYLRELVLLIRVSFRLLGSTSELRFTGSPETGRR